MGVLGKDLLDFHRPRTNTKAEFGASGYWVESHPTMQPYGAVLTEILNLDAAPFQELLDYYRKTVAEKDAEQAAREFQAVTNGFASLPLYRLYWNDVQLFASMDVRELFVGEAQEAFREYVMQDDTLPRFMCRSGRRRGFPGTWFGYWWFDSSAIFLLWRGRNEADLWNGFSLWIDCLCLFT